MTGIIDTSCISPQRTFGVRPFEGGVVEHAGTRYEVVEPDYSGLIPKGQLRRMGKFMRMGITAGGALLKKHQPLDGVVIGTGNGGLGHTVKFLDQIMAWNEGTLAPTHFVQSTPNSVAGSLALSTQNTGYNATYVSAGLAFESALIDALLLLEEGVARRLLTGSVDEISDYNHNIDTHRKRYKNNEKTTSSKLIGSGTPGTVAGEGAAMFVLNKDAALGIPAVTDVVTIQTVLHDDVRETVLWLLDKNNIKPGDIGCVISGLNGDVQGDKFYHMLTDELFSYQNIVTFKNLVGEYPSSSGFALWMATARGGIPAGSIYRKGKSDGEFVLIYNHCRGLHHGFILVRNREVSRQVNRFYQRCS